MIAAEAVNTCAAVSTRVLSGDLLGSGRQPGPDVGLAADIAHQTREKIGHPRPPQSLYRRVLTATSWADARRCTFSLTLQSGVPIQHGAANRQRRTVGRSLPTQTGIAEVGTVDTHTGTGRNLALGVHCRRAALRNDGNVRISARAPGRLLLDAQGNALFRHSRSPRPGTRRIARGGA